jgi:hypothetical protein
VYIDLHEFFFHEFPNILAEWIEIFLENTGIHRPAMQNNLTLELVGQVQLVDNRMSRIVEFWLDNVLGGYVTEFYIDYTHNYSVLERYFFKGL